MIPQMAKKTAALTVRFTDEQHERLRELAATSGLESAQRAGCRPIPPGEAEKWFALLG